MTRHKLEIVLTVAWVVAFFGCLAVAFWKGC